MVDSIRFSIDSTKPDFHSIEMVIADQSDYLPHEMQDIDFGVEINETSLIDGSYGYDSGNGSFNGMIGFIQRGEADIGVQVDRYHIKAIFINNKANTYKSRAGHKQHQMT